MTAQRRPTGPVKAGTPLVIQLSPEPSEKPGMNSPTLNVSLELRKVPALPPVSKGQVSPPNVPWVGHKQLSKLRAGREKALTGQKRRTSAANGSLPDGVHGEADTWRGLSTQGNTYSCTDGVAGRVETGNLRARSSNQADRIRAEEAGMERLGLVASVARVKGTSHLKPEKGMKGEDLCSDEDEKGAARDADGGKLSSEGSGSRHSIRPLTNKLACQDTIDPGSRALSPVQSRSPLFFAHNGPSVLAPTLLSEIAPIATPQSPLASSKYGLDILPWGVPDRAHSSPLRRNKKRGPELSESAAGLLIGVEDRVRTSELERLEEVASPRARAALARALQPLPNGPQRRNDTSKANRKEKTAALDAEVAARVKSEPPRREPGEEYRSWSVPPTRVESSQVWHRTLSPMLSPESRAEMADFKALLVDSLRSTGQSGKDAEEKAELIFGACFHEIHRRMPALQKALADSKKVARVLHEENAVLRRAMTSLERKQDQLAMDTWLQQHGDRLAEVLVVGPDQARPRQGPLMPSNNPFLRMPTFKPGSLGAPTEPRLSAGASGRESDHDTDGLVPEIAENAQGESARALADSEQFLAGLKLGMAAGKSVAGEKATGVKPFGARQKEGVTKVDVSVQTGDLLVDRVMEKDGVVLGGEQKRGHSMGSRIDVRSPSREPEHSSASLGREESRGEVGAPGEATGAFDEAESAPGRRVWNPFRRAGPTNYHEQRVGIRLQSEANMGDAEKGTGSGAMEETAAARSAHEETTDGAPEDQAEGKSVGARENGAVENDAMGGADLDSADVESFPSVLQAEFARQQETEIDTERGVQLLSMEGTSESVGEAGRAAAEQHDAAAADRLTVALVEERPGVASNEFAAHNQASTSVKFDQRETIAEIPTSKTDTGRATPEEVGGLPDNSDPLSQSLERAPSNRFNVQLIPPPVLDLSASEFSPTSVSGNDTFEVPSGSPGPKSPSLLIGDTPFSRLKRSESISESVQRRRERAERRKTHGEFLRLSAAVPEFSPKPRLINGQGSGTEAFPESVATEYFPEGVPAAAQKRLPRESKSAQSSSVAPGRESQERKADEWEAAGTAADATWRAEVQRLQVENARAREEVEERERERQRAVDEAVALRAELERMREQEARVAVESEVQPLDVDAQIAAAVAARGGVRFLSTQYAALLGDENVEIRVERTGGAMGEVAVHYTTMDGSAHAGLDFTATEGLLTWPEGASGPQSIWIQLLEDEFGDSGEQEFAILLTLEGHSEAVVLGDSSARVVVSGPGSARWERTGRSRNQSRESDKRPKLHATETVSTQSQTAVQTATEEGNREDSVTGENRSRAKMTWDGNGLVPPTFAHKSGTVWKQRVNERREEKGLPPLEFSKRMKLPIEWEKFIEEGVADAGPQIDKDTAEIPTSGSSPQTKKRVPGGSSTGQVSPSKVDNFDAEEERARGDRGPAAGPAAKAELVLKGARKGRHLSSFLVSNARVMPAKKLRVLIGGIYRAKQAANAVDDKAGRARAPLSDLVVGHLKHMLGLRSLAQAKLQEMLATLRCFYRKKTDHLAGLFTRLTGLYDDLPGHGVNSVMQILDVCSWSLNGPAAFWSQLERGDIVLLTPSQLESVVGRVLETRPPELIEAVLTKIHEQNRAGNLGNDVAFASRPDVRKPESVSGLKKDLEAGSVARGATPRSAHSRGQGQRTFSRGDPPRNNSAGVQNRGGQRAPSPFGGEAAAGDLGGDVAPPVPLDRLLCYLVHKSSLLQAADEAVLRGVMRRAQEPERGEGLTREGFHAAMQCLDLPAWFNDATVDHVFELAAETDGDNRPSDSALSVDSCVAAFRAVCPGLHGVKELARGDND